jgi:hypothetical protein
MRTLPAAVLPLLLAGLPAQSPAAPTWHTDLAAAKKVAAETRAPLFVTFRCER